MSSLAYINEAISTELTARRENAASTITPEDKKTIHNKSIKVVAGFEISDEQAEQAALDSLIADRRAVIDTFLKARETITKKLTEKDIKPLAVVPTVAWHAICDDAKLFRLSPDNEGRVGIQPDALNRFFSQVSAESTNQWGRKFKYDRFSITPENERQLLDYASKHWAECLHALFNGYASGYVGDNKATVVLPQPPKDVADILIKANGAFPLKVAAVPEAIGFKESLIELVRNYLAERTRESQRAEAWKADPIIYTEEGVATAVIAQFGDFPIEKAVVDGVLATKALLPEAPSQVDLMKAANAPLINTYHQLVRNNIVAQARGMAEAAMYQQAPGILYGGIGGGFAGGGGGGGAGGAGGYAVSTGGGFTLSTSTSTSPYQAMNSRSWTGL